MLSPFCTWTGYMTLLMLWFQTNTSDYYNKKLQWRYNSEKEEKIEKLRKCSALFKSSQIYLHSAFFTTHFFKAESQDVSVNNIFFTLCLIVAFIRLELIDNIVYILFILFYIVQLNVDNVLYPDNVGIVVI